MGKFLITFRGLVLDSLGLGEMGAEIMGGARLQGLTVLHHGLDGKRIVGARETLVFGLLAGDDRHRHDTLGKFPVDLQHPERFLERVLPVYMGGVPFLPEKLRRPQEQPGAHLPAHHVGPLIDQNRQIPVGPDPIAERIRDDGFRGGPDD